MNAFTGPTFRPGTPRVVSDNGVSPALRPVGVPPAPPPISLCPPPERRPGIPGPVLALLEQRHRRHLIAAQFWHHPSNGASDITPQHGARDFQMMEAAAIRHAVQQSGDTGTAQAMNLLEAEAYLTFRRPI